MLTSAKSILDSVRARWLEVLRSLDLPPDVEMSLRETEPAPSESLTEWAQRLGVDSDKALQAVAQTLRIAYFPELSGLSPCSRFVERISISYARRHQLLAVRNPEGQAYLVMGGLRSWRLGNTVNRFLASHYQPAFAPQSTILDQINTSYGQRTGQAQSVVDSLEPGDVTAQVAALDTKEDLLDGSQRSPVIQLVNALVFEAVQLGASDVHIQPREDHVMVRMRIDGILFEAHQLPKQVQEEIVSRVKVQGKMNIAEKRLPQDGRATVRVGEKLVDLRIASLPSSYGERIVIRILDKSARLYTLTELGMDASTLKQFGQLVHLEHGLILVTGPTGSGKSTTLYAALQAINTKDRNALTLEDPIEFDIAGVSQTQINTKKGLTFATGLRNVLRQDPDIIMVGEIRDQETAVMGIQSALTGHLVFSTLHTNDAASAITRLLDLGIEPYLVSSSLLAVLAQRLVRRVCRECAQQHPVTTLQLARLGLPADQSLVESVTVGAGCEHCRGTGYRGRIGIFELLCVDQDVRSAIQRRASAAEIRETALRGEMQLLRDSGIGRIAAGETTVEEVERVTMRTTL